MLTKLSLSLLTLIADQDDSKCVCVYTVCVCVCVCVCIVFTDTGQEELSSRKESRRPACCICMRGFSLWVGFANFENRKKKIPIFQLYF